MNPPPLIVLALVATPLAAQTPPIHSPNQLPLPLRKAIVDLSASCKGFGGTPGKSPQLVKFADLTGDGVGDYVVDVAVYDCQGAESAMTNGQSGSDLQIYVGGPNNIATSSWSASVFGMKIETTNGKPVLWVDVAGLECGQRNAANVSIADWKYCSRALLWNAATHKFAFAPLAQARPVG